MASAQWTYEVPPAGESSVGLEEYGVESASGEYVGAVRVVLRRDADLYLAVERGTPPVRRDLRAVKIDDVERIDHAGTTIRLKLGDDALDAAPELAPENAVEGERAEASRVTELPPELTAPSSPTAPRTVDRTSFMAAIVLTVLGVFSVLVLVIFLTTVDFGWQFALFAIPAVLLAVAAYQMYRFVRRPSERA